MAVVNTKSTIITNADAASRVPVQPFLEGGHLSVACAANAIAAADDNGSVYRYIRLKSGARMHSIKMLFDAITGGTSFTLGLYDTAANGGAAVSAALFATALDLSAGSTTGVEVLNQNNSVGNAEKRLWELLGLAADPFKDYDLCLVGTTVGSGAGNVICLASYVI